jgi:signal transduction histidine kinase
MRGPRSIYAELREHFFPRDPSAAEDEAFAAYALARVQPQATVTMIATLVVSVLWWPTDALVVRRFPEVAGAFLRWRVGVPLLALAHLATARLPRPLLRVGLSAVAFGALFGWATAHGSGLDRPWIHVIGVITLATLTLPLQLGPRVAITTLLAASILGGFALASPDALRSPYLAFFVAFQVSLVAVSISLGHAQFLLLRKNFLQERALARHGDHLEAVVAERTAELRVLLASVESAREEERARISRDLHDSLGQELAALRYALTYARSRYETDREGARANLAELDALIGQMSATTRAILNDLRPTVLDHLGLAAAAEWLARNVARRAGLRCDVEVTGGEHAGAVPGERAASLFRIVQESLSNVTRHADASAATVALAIGADGAVALEVRDDGVGCGGRAGPGALGLITMRERAESMGGRFAIDTRPGFAGTRVRVTIPAG